MNSRVTINKVGVDEDIPIMEPASINHDTNERFDTKLPFLSVHWSKSDQPGANPGFLRNQMDSSKENKTRMTSS